MSVTRDILNRLGCFKKDIFDTLEKVIVFEETGINKERLMDCKMLSVPAYYNTDQ